MRKAKLSVLTLCVLISGGCVSGDWQGLVPGKSVHAKGVKHEVSTPWGRSVTTIDELDTTAHLDDTATIKK